MPLVFACRMANAMLSTVAPEVGFFRSDPPACTRWPCTESRTLPETSMLLFWRACVRTRGPKRDNELLGRLVKPFVRCVLFPSPIMASCSPTALYTLSMDISIQCICLCHRIATRTTGWSTNSQAGIFPNGVDQP